MCAMISARLVALERVAERVLDERVRLLERLIEPRAGELAEPLPGVGERHLAPRRRALDAQDARVGRQLGEERGDERRLADAHLAVIDARDHRALAAVGPAHRRW